MADYLQYLLTTPMREYTLLDVLILFAAILAIAAPFIWKDLQR